MTLCVAGIWEEMRVNKSLSYLVCSVLDGSSEVLFENFEGFMESPPISDDGE